MKFASQLAVILAVTAGLAACSGDGTTTPNEDAPHLGNIAVGSAPEPPPGRVVLCPDNGTSTTNGAACPVIIWNGITYWAFSYEDNRNSVQVVGYNSDNLIVKTLPEKVGTKNVWEIVINDAQQTITLRGQGDQVVNFPWSELPL